MQSGQKADTQQISLSNSPKKDSLSRRLIQASLITLLAYLLSLLFTQPFTFSAGTMLSGAEKNDFNLTDFYNIVADSRPIRSLDSDILIVDIADAEREDIADILAMMGDMKPAAVGLDVTFNDPRPDDGRLIDAITNCPNPVLAIGVSEAPGSKGKFLVDDYSYFYPELRNSISHGVINLPSKFSGATIRSFMPEFIAANGDTLSSMALSLARAVNPEAARKLKARSDKTLLIDFPSRTFTVIPWYAVPDNAEQIEGKIVLIGSMAETEDAHATPVNNKMSGVLIHAYATSTILRGAEYKAVGRAINMAIAFVLCFLLCLNNLSYKTPARGLWLRLIQLGCLYLILRIGYYMFVDKHIIVDFSETILMLAFGFFALDIWAGLQYYCTKFYHKLKKK